MPRLKPGDEPLSPEEDAAVAAGIKADPDTIELDAEWFAGAHPASHALPHIVDEYLRTRVDQKAGVNSENVNASHLPAQRLRARVAPTGRSGGSPMTMDPINLYDYEARAKLALPHNNWEFIEAGSMDEFTTRRNRSAFEQLTLRPRFLRDVSERNISTTVLGQEISMPVMVSPAGSHMLAHPDGEVATAQGAGRSDTLMMLSTSSNYSMEEVSEAATGPLWFQLYHRGYHFSEMLVHRAEEAGFKAIVLTVDTPLPSPKERDLRNHFQREFELGNFRGMGADPTAISGTDETPGWDVASAPSLTWRELEWLRGLTSLPLVLKGVRTAEDAHQAVENGVDGILVSTHGGRQLDMTMGAIEMVPEIVAAARGQAEVYVDSGVRRGSDVIKALALGAKAVAIGRPLFWGLAVDGANGVHGVLELLREEVSRALGYCGQTDVNSLEPGLINIPYGWGAGTTAP